MVENLIKYVCVSILFLLSIGGRCDGQSVQKSNSMEPFGDSMRHWYGIRDEHNNINPVKNQPQYSHEEVAKIADNMLLYQRNNGGWPKNYDMQAILTTEQIASLRASKTETNTTFDNSTTYSQIEYLAKAYSITKNKKYKTAVLKGLEFVLRAQYPNGGWPQYYPLEDGYSRRITYNDGAMIGILSLLKSFDNQEADFNFIPLEMRKQIHHAVEKGLECILKTQIVSQNERTAWCQQHDEATLLPAWARAFEPPAICNAESAAIVRFLMEIENPTAEIIEAVQQAVKWFLHSRIYYTAVKTIDAPEEQTPQRTIKTDRVVVIDSTAAPIWTRFYEIDSQRPMFSDRNSKILYSLSEVSRERRAGYSWYTYAPQRIIDIYSKWAKNWNVESVIKAD